MHFSVYLLVNENVSPNFQFICSQVWITFNWMYQSVLLGFSFERNGIFFVLCVSLRFRKEKRKFVCGDDCLTTVVIYSLQQIGFERIFGLFLGMLFQLNDNKVYYVNKLSKYRYLTVNLLGYGGYFGRRFKGLLIIGI